MTLVAQFGVVFGVLLQFAGQHVFLVIFGAIITNLILKRYRSGLRQTPGPFVASFSNIWRFNVVRNEDMPWTSIRLHEKLGPLVRIGPKHVSVSSPESVPVIYGSNSQYRKSPFFMTSQARYDGEVLENIFATPNIEYHNRMRRTIGNAYSTTAITELEPLLDHCVNLFVSRLRESSVPTPRAFNIGDWLQYYSFDCLGIISFSKQIGFLKTGSDVGGMIRIVDKIFDYVALIGQSPILDKWLLGNPLLRLFETNAQKSGGILTYAIDNINERVEKPSEHKDLLSRLFEINKANPERLSFRDIVSVMSINVFAGHDALAISMRTMLYYLCRHPEPYRQLLQEIREADAAGSLSKPATYVEANNLPYLSAVINEAFRIHPPVGLILERLVPRGGVTLHGVHLPMDTVVGINAWVLHRNKSIFGEDVNDFRPERWIDSDPEQIKEMRKNLFTFGAGSRACIGTTIAKIEIFKLICELCRHFDFRLADPAKSWKYQGTWVTKQTEMDMIFTERQVNDEKAVA